ncbi:MAG: hypothetical protein JNL70_04265 [Saprospiraceae bacterium]|nr:hypothetical protein [Saprospiraceae bacterium]
MEQRENPSNRPQKEEILQKITEVGDLIKDYFSSYVKTTSGQGRVGAASLEFIKNCHKYSLLTPGILSVSFPKEDFEAKKNGAVDLFDFIKALNDIVVEADVSGKICKNDSMYYSNDYYTVLKKESGRNNLYKPYFQVVEPFYKKSKTDNGESKKKKTSKKDTPPT